MQDLALAELVPAAVGIALNPPAVVAVILMLSSAHPRRNALAFLGGWMSGLFAVGGVVVIAGEATDGIGGPTVAGLVVQLVLGVVLLVLAYGKWRAQLSSEDEKEMPGWMRSLSEYSGAKAFVTAALFAGLNPKTLAINVAGVALIVGANLTLAAEWLTLVAFVCLASFTVALPVVLYLVAPRRSKVALDSAEAWLIANSAGVTGTVLLVLGVMLVAAGAQGLVAL